MLDSQYQLAKERTGELLGENLRLFEDAVELAVVSNFHDIVHDMTSTSIGKAKDSPNLKVNYFYNVAVP